MAGRRGRNAPTVERTPRSYDKCCILFRMLGIKPGTQSWPDYEAGKSLLEAYYPMEPEEYFYHVDCLAKWLGV